MIDLRDLVKDSPSVDVRIQGQEEVTYFKEMKFLAIALVKIFLPWRLLKAIFEVFLYGVSVFFAAAFLVFLPVVTLIVFKFRKEQERYLKQEILSSFLKK